MLWNLSFLLFVCIVSATEPLRVLELEEIKGIARQKDALNRVCGIYYTLKLGEIWNLPLPVVDCKSFPQDTKDAEHLYYSHYVSEKLNCNRPKLDNLDEVFSSDDMDLKEMYYAILLNPKSKLLNKNKLSQEIASILKPCVKGTCKDVSVSNIAYGIMILKYFGPNLPSMDHDINFNSLLENVVKGITADKAIQVKEDNLIVSLSNLVITVPSLTSQPLSLSFDTLSALSSFFLEHRHSTSKSRLLAVINGLRTLSPAASSVSLMFMSSAWNKGRVTVRVTDVLDVPIEGLQVTIESIRNEEKVVAENVLTEQVRGEFEASLTLASGIYSLQAIISKNDQPVGTLSASLVVPTLFEVSEYQVTIDQDVQTFAVPEPMTADESRLRSVADTSLINIKITLKSAKKPEFAALVISQRAGSLRSVIPLTLGANNVFTSSFSFQQKQIAEDLKYTSGVYTLSLHIGDSLQQSHILTYFYISRVDFTTQRQKVHYPLYSKPLLYESESSTESLPELHHTFRSENKNPFFIFPFFFSIMVVVSLSVLIFGWSRIGFSFKTEAISKKLIRFVFFVLVSIILFLYFIFWFAWNLGSMLKVVIPVVLLTVLVGNIALKD